MDRLPDDALVVRGGLNLPEQFVTGSGITIDADGKLHGISVNSATHKTLRELSASLPNNRIGITTVGEIRADGGDVHPAPSQINPHHCQMSGITAQKAHRLFTPTVPNPSRVR